MRIVGLDDALPASLDVDINRLEVARNYTQRYLHLGSQSAFTEIQTLRAYCKEAASGYYVHPSVLWSLDNYVLTFKGMEISITGLGLFMRSLINEAEELLLTKLLFEKEAYLEKFSPALVIADDPTWAKNGDSFVDLLGHSHLLAGEARVAGSALKHPEGAALFSQRPQTCKYCCPVYTYQLLIIYS